MLLKYAIIYTFSSKVVVCFFLHRVCFVLRKKELKFNKIKIKKPTQIVSQERERERDKIKIIENPIIICLYLKLNKLK